MIIHIDQRELRAKQRANIRWHVIEILKGVVACTLVMIASYTVAALLTLEIMKGQ